MLIEICFGILGCFITLLLVVAWMSLTLDKRDRRLSKTWRPRGES